MKLFFLAIMSLMLTNVFAQNDAGPKNPGPKRLYQSDLTAKDWRLIEENNGTPQEYWVIAVKISNVGGAYSGQTSALFSSCGSMVVSIPPIKGNSSKEIYFRIDSGSKRILCSSGAFRITLDNSNRVRELNEQNNTLDGVVPS